MYLADFSFESGRSLYWPKFCVVFYTEAIEKVQKYNFFNSFATDFNYFYGRYELLK